jgi:uncharacterized damage-inducible protein DinB
MEMKPATALAYIRDAFTKMLAVVDRLGDDKVNVEPHGPGTNSAAALVVHCCGVTRWWLGAVGLGQTVERNRDAEFEATATVAELHALVEATVAHAESDVEALDAGRSVPDHPARVHLVDGDSSDASLVIHVIEELYQHLGHMELTADALGAGAGKGAAQG